MATATVEGLVPDARYVAYVVAQDDEHAGSDFEGCNLQAAVTTLPFRTRDAAPPLFVAASPIAAPLPGAEGAFAVILTATLDEPGTVWAMAVPEGAAAPSLSSLLLHGNSSEVREPLHCLSRRVPLANGCMPTVRAVGVSCADALMMAMMRLLAVQAAADMESGAVAAVCNATAATAATAAVCVLHGLAAETAYDVYVTAEDVADEDVTRGRPLSPNRQPEATRLGVRTHDVTPPKLALAAPVAAPLSGSAAALRVALNEPGRVAFVVLPATSPPPVSAAVVARPPHHTAEVTVHGTVDLPHAEILVTHVIAGLQSDMSYVVYLVAEDQGLAGDGEFRNAGAITSVTFRTPDMTPPTLPAWAASPTDVVRGVRGHEVQLVTALDEPGTVSYVVRPFAAAAAVLVPPTATQVATCDVPQLVACGRVAVPEAGENVTFVVPAPYVPNCS
jgi:hypothetical protein